jgi:hypothetical protein
VNIYAQRIKLRHNKSGTQNEAIDRGFESQSGQAKDNKIGICCFSAKNAALRRKSKETGKCVRVGRHVYPRTACFIKLTL